MRMSAVVEHRGKFQNSCFEPRLFKDFTRHTLGGGLIHVCPSTRQRPPSVAGLTHHQDLAIDEGGTTHIDFGCGVPEFLIEQIQDSGAVGPRSVGHQHRGDFTHALEAQQIERIFAEGQAGLSNGL